MSKLPHVVVLDGVLCDSGDKRDVEVWAFCVVNSGGGVGAVSVGSENVGHWQDVLESGGDDAHGVCKLGVGDEVGSSGGWLYHPLGEAVVCVVAMLKEVPVISTHPFMNVVPTVASVRTFPSSVSSVTKGTQQVPSGWMKRCSCWVVCVDV